MFNRAHRSQRSAGSSPELVKAASVGILDHVTGAPCQPNVYSEGGDHGVLITRPNAVVQTSEPGPNVQATIHYLGRSQAIGLIGDTEDDQRRYFLMNNTKNASFTD